MARSIAGRWSARHGPPLTGCAARRTREASRVTNTAGERGALAWQHLGRLRRDEERKDRSTNINIGTLFAIQSHTTADQIRDRLRAMVQRECALRITDASLDD